MTPASFTRAYVAHDLGADLHRWACRVAAACAVVYVAGLVVGEAVHWLNDWLAGDCRPWPVRWGSRADAAAPTPAIVVLAGRNKRPSRTAQAYINWLYKEDGRDAPSHPKHGLYTGLLQSRISQLIAYDQTVALSPND